VLWEPIRRKHRTRRTPRLSVSGTGRCETIKKKKIPNEYGKEIGRRKKGH